MKLQQKAASGFTLVEMLITIVLVSALGIVGSNMFYNNVLTAKSVNTAAASADQARYAIDRVARELREIKYDTTTKGYSITSMGASSVSFTRAANGSTAESNITISLANGDLSISSSVSGSTTSRVLASNVQNVGSNPLFTYQTYSIDQTTGLGVIGTTTSASDIRWIVVQFAVAVDSSNTKTTSQRVRVSLRN